MNHHSTWKIIARNTFTLFNLVNVVLAVMVALVGSYKNMLFILIAIANTLISIINELRAKKIVDKMRLLAEQKPTILKDGKPTQVSPDAVQKGDLVILSLGDQVMYDSVVQGGQLEVNESFVTGEQDNIKKLPGDQLISGSFVVSGTATAKVINIGADNFVTKLQQEASSIKTADSKLFKLMNNIVKYISWTLIPIGALLLWARFRTEADTNTAVTSTVAALINMIPEGLILLTSSVLALATIRLSRKKVLVQDLYSIETLARIDTICLDKTGTLTTGRMTVKDALLPDGTPIDFTHPTTPAENRFKTALEAILTNQMSDNATTIALKTKLLRTPKNRATAQNAKIGPITEVIPFSSDRKYSGIVTKNTTYLMGAIEFVTDNQDLIKEVKNVSEGYRTLAVVEIPTGGVAGGTPTTRSEVSVVGEAATTGPVGGATLMGIIRLEDEIRSDAKEIIQYFYDNQVAVKIISGDDLEAVTSIARTVGIQDLKGINLSTLKTKNYSKLVKEYSIFTRVTPTEKKSLITALKKQGNTVAMTGDGVNDILAMKEADVSIAIGEGSDAARRASKIVLLGSDFSAVPSIIAEGRQSINNLERSTSLFLAKTVYASTLAVLFVFLPLSYPYTPIEMSLLNFACIGFPGLALALEHNTERIKNKFLYNIKHYSVPTGIAVVVSMLILALVAHFLTLDKHLYTTLSTVITFLIGLILIYQISKPLNLFRTLLILFIIAVVVLALLLPFTRTFFEFI